MSDEGLSIFDDEPNDADKSTETSKPRRPPPRRPPRGQDPGDARGRGPGTVRLEARPEAGGARPGGARPGAARQGDPGRGRPHPGPPARPAGAHGAGRRQPRARTCAGARAAPAAPGDRRGGLPAGATWWLRQGRRRRPGRPADQREGRALPQPDRVGEAGGRPRAAARRGPRAARRERDAVVRRPGRPGERDAAPQRGGGQRRARRGPARR